MLFWLQIHFVGDWINKPILQHVVCFSDKLPISSCKICDCKMLKTCHYRSTHWQIKCHAHNRGKPQASVNEQCFDQCYILILSRWDWPLHTLTEKLLRTATCHCSQLSHTCAREGPQMCTSHCMHVAQGTLGIPYENLRNDMSQQLESGVYSVALHLNFRSVLTDNRHRGWQTRIQKAKCTKHSQLCHG